MNTKQGLLRVVLGFSVLVVTASQVLAQGGPPWAGQRGGPGRGPGWAGQGGGPGRGPGWAGRGGPADAQFSADRDVFHFLLLNHDQIRREVKNTKNGVETLTESAKPEIAAKLQEHVAAMVKRVEGRQPIHMRDPLFAEVFRHADKIHVKYEKTPQGVRVVETSEDPYVTQLIQAHGGVVSLFVKHGFDEVRKNHEVPGAKDSAATAAESTATVSGPPGACPLAAGGQCPRAAAGQCPRAAVGQCPAGKNCPLVKPCPAGKDCPQAKACPAGKDCPFAQQCPSGRACAGCPAAGTCPLSGVDQAPPLPQTSDKPKSK